MAKKRRITLSEEQRQSRKEVLLARRQQRQRRQIFLVVGAIVALLLLVLVVGLVNELIVKPTQPVAVVTGRPIALRDWQTRVRLQRAQLILGIEDLAEALGQDIGQVQQFAGQQINLLLDDQTLGQLVLDELIDEEIIRQGAAARGIAVSDADLQKELEESFNYFEGVSPTATPTSTQTPVPTPSLTPIPTAVITEVVATVTPQPTPTVGPTSTPLPTSTPVTLESYEESLAEVLGRFKDLGIQETAFMELIRAQMLEERLRDALAAEQGVPNEAQQASFFYLTIGEEDEAEALLGQVTSQGFLTVWNGIRSRTPEEAEERSASARELIWRTQEDVAALFSSDVAEVVFNLPIGQPSELLVVPSMTDEAGDTFYLVQVSGREVRPLTQTEIDNLKNQAMQLWLDAQRTVDVEVFDRWRMNVPRRPMLDPRFLIAPTPAPEIPTGEAQPVMPEPSPTPGS
jgi:peptidyl-prolyl cis-trans isomerase D